MLSPRKSPIAAQRDPSGRMWADGINLAPSEHSVPPMPAPWAEGPPGLV